MRLLGFEINRASGSTDLVVKKDAQPLFSGMGNWFPIIREPFTGAWQQGRAQRTQNLAAFHAVYSCVTLIASDLGKLRLRLMQQDSDGIWSESKTSTYRAVLNRPNNYQNRIKFIEHWLICKLLAGNAYILKTRDNRGGPATTQGAVNGLYVLNPLRVKPLVTSEGDVYYQLGGDNLNDVIDGTIVPASEIIHDPMVPLYHPLCGVSPITACALAANQGMTIQENSAAFFANGSNPGGIMTAPGFINDETAKRLKEHWEKNYSKGNSGRIAILGDGLAFNKLSLSAADSQLIEQLKWSATVVCSCYRVPPYKVNLGDMPKFNNIEALDQQYYSQCLQSLIECVELLLTEGLGLASNYGVQFDLDGLLRMDQATAMETAKNGVSGGILKPNEARAKFDLPPVKGGDTPYLQEQNYSLAALAKRDAQDNPFGAKAPPAAPAAPAPTPEPDKALSPEFIAGVFDHMLDADMAALGKG
jgi:HK97 family phage portal protein